METLLRKHKSSKSKVRLSPYLIGLAIATVKPLPHQLDILALLQIQNLREIASSKYFLVCGASNIFLLEVHQDLLEFD